MSSARAPVGGDDLLEGRTLAAQLAAGAVFDWREALRVVGRLAEALDHVHAGGVVHRDVRPANIMVLTSGEPRLMDVGVAGSPPYMSPEQVVGESVDARTDIFSLGAVAYRLVTGRDAFGAHSGPRETLAQIVYDTPPVPSSLVPVFPPDGDAVIARALAKSRKDRYANARSLAEDVEDLLAGRRPRHSEGCAWAGGTERSPGGLASSAHEGVPEPATPASASRSGSAPAARRRSNVRGLGGVAALALVLGAELLRRGEASSTSAVPTATPPISSAESSGEPPPASVFDPTLPSVNPPAPAPAPEAEAEAETAHVWLEIRHPLASGRLRVSVDGTKVLDQGLSARKATGILGVALREGRARRALDVGPGRHRIAVEVLWDDERRARSIVGTFKPGATRRLSARLSWLGKNLTLEWEG